ncbi:hypothetical protein GGR50DRAFT_692274 [Xylaria sp. CBS 124048]|nr:hypothetical protein GGR50DRAFT_692274 [Xylaria sp. CBS 124048]
MTRTLGASLPIEDSQVSQRKLLYLMQEHGVGVQTIDSPIQDDVIDNNDAHPSITAALSAPSIARKSDQSQVPESASDASVDEPNFSSNTHTDANIDPNTDVFTATVNTTNTANEQRRRLRSTTSAPRDAHPADNPHTPPIRDDALPHSLPLKPLNKRMRAMMASQSPTQSNNGRSYDQYERYERPDSQPSPPGSLLEDRRTLQEGDTGYVDFKCSFELPDTAPFDPDMPQTEDKENNPHDRSQLASQTARPSRSVPETPATLPSKSFISCGTEQLIAPSQLFGQTQPTSGLKKTSPTSSRPSPNILGNTLASSSQPVSSPLQTRGRRIASLAAPRSASPSLPGHSPRPSDSRTSRSPSPVNVSDAVEDQEGVESDKAPLPKLDPRGSRSRSGLQPLGEFRPYRRRLRNSNPTRSSSQNSIDSDFEQDEAELRRQRAKSNKERASRSFPEIRVPFPNLGKSKVEVPSTNRARHSKSRHSSEERVARGRYTTYLDGSQETVADSQDAAIRQSMNDSDDLTLTATNRDERNRRPFGGAVRVEEETEIPETSSPCLSTAPRKPIGNMISVKCTASSGMPASSLPMPSTTLGPLSSVNRSQSEPNVPPATGVGRRNTESVVTTSSPAVIASSQPQSSTERRGELERPVTPSGALPEPSEPGTTSSTLTVLSTPPSVTPEMTRSIEADHVTESPELGNTTGPAAGRTKGQESPSLSVSGPPTPKPKAKSYGRPRLIFNKGARHSSRNDSLSSDAPVKTNAPTVSKARSVTRKSPRKTSILREFSTKRGIFEGMAFAISLQERPPSRSSKDKVPSKSSLEDLIRQEGGRILNEGFDPLFKFDALRTSTSAKSSSSSSSSSSAPILSSSIKLLDETVGFAALIADGHSRKVKYMQALALGIPCLAPRWITTCVAKREIIDWSSYLLCAGSSSVLGDAIRSRNLLPYDASTAKLTEVISQRPKLLDGSRVLLMMKKSKNEEKRLPYVFLAQVLGASLVRVNSIEEARSKLREAENKEGDKGFDWVYVDDRVHDARTALFGGGSGGNEKISRKRRRGSAVGDGTGGEGMGDEGGKRPLKRIRTLNDELVIQSLILGRLIEEDEV